jgi:hypothetical protein
MFDPVASVPVDCSLVLAARVAGAALPGLAIVALEASLRVPVRPLFAGCLQEVHARAAAFFRRFPF